MDMMQAFTAFLLVMAFVGAIILFGARPARNSDIIIVRGSTINQCILRSMEYTASGLWDVEKPLENDGIFGFGCRITLKRKYHPPEHKPFVVTSWLANPIPHADVVWAESAEKAEMKVNYCDDPKDWELHKKYYPPEQRYKVRPLAEGEKFNCVHCLLSVVSRK